VLVVRLGMGLRICSSWLGVCEMFYKSPVENVRDGTSLITFTFHFHDTRPFISLMHVIASGFCGDGFIFFFFV
jgi:hypothetical protein